MKKIAILTLMVSMFFILGCKQNIDTDLSNKDGVNTNNLPVVVASNFPGFQLSKEAANFPENTIVTRDGRVFIRDTGTSNTVDSINKFLQSNNINSQISVDMLNIREDNPFKDSSSFRSVETENTYTNFYSSNSSLSTIDAFDVNYDNSGKIATARFLINDGEISQVTILENKNNYSDDLTENVKDLLKIIDNENITIQFRVWYWSETNTKDVEYSIMCWKSDEERKNNEYSYELTVKESYPTENGLIKQLLLLNNNKVLSSAKDLANLSLTLLKTIPESVSIRKYTEENSPEYPELWGNTYIDVEDERYNYNDYTTNEKIEIIQKDIDTLKY